VQVASLVRSGDVDLQPHHIFAVNSLLDDAARVAVNITKPGVAFFSLSFSVVFFAECAKPCLLCSAFSVDSVELCCLVVSVELCFLVVSVELC